MRTHWPARAQRAWRQMTARRRQCGRVIIKWIEDVYFGFGVGQQRLVTDIAEHTGQPAALVLDALCELRRRGLVRRRRYKGMAMVWVPEDLLAEGVPAREEGVWTEWDPWTADEEGGATGDQRT